MSESRSSSSESRSFSIIVCSFDGLEIEIIDSGSGNQADGDQGVRPFQADHIPLLYFGIPSAQLFEFADGVPVEFAVCQGTFGFNLFIYRGKVKFLFGRIEIDFRQMGERNQSQLLPVVSYGNNRTVLPAAGSDPTIRGSRVMRPVR